jgi:uncharacterized sulfatase
MMSAPLRLGACGWFLRDWFLRAFGSAFGLFASLAALVAADRPNILWLTAEDMSPNLGCYGDPYAVTPHLDAFAKQAVRYTRAFATAPVCSPARSCLITGLYATSLGTQRLRSQFPIPREFRGFPAYLREAGYYCVNNVKTDYNLRDEAEFIRDTWDESSPKAHWRGRRQGQPFFAVINFMTTHQSRTSVWPPAEFEQEVGARLSMSDRHDPAKASLPPYYPDTPEARRAWARYHDCITALDMQVADRLAELEKDGLAEDTIVFFYSDHGMGTPRGKRTLFDSGLQVPLLVRFPPKWRHLAPTNAGGTTDRLVSFVDFAPTVLSLAGVPAPKHFQGIAFLGPAAGRPREFVFGARDRVDEAFDLARSVRDGRWLYIRNFMPHLSWMQPERYSDAAPFRQEFKRLGAEGKLGVDQLGYAAPRRALEELYDTQADPHQLRNLATEPAHRGTLERLRGALRAWMIASRDAGLLTEPQMWERIQPAGTPFEFAQNPRRYPLARLLDAADLAGRPDAEGRQIRLLRERDDALRYWGALGLGAAEQLSARSRAALERVLDDASPVVRIEAAAALARGGVTGRPLHVLESELSISRPETMLHAARALELLGEKARAAQPAMEKALAFAREQEAKSEIFLFVRFSLEAALEKWSADKSGDK